MFDPVLTGRQTEARRIYVSLDAFKEDNVVQYDVILFMRPRGADLAGRREPYL